MANYQIRVLKELINYPKDSQKCKTKHHTVSCIEPKFQYK